LFDLLDLREIDLSAIKQQAQKIKDLKEKIANTPLQEDETKKLEKEINSIDGNLMDLKIQISKSERRMDNIESELKNKKSSLKVLLEKINVKIKETQDL
ncbi:hypothetical protein GOV14_03850, partial [Candidatus Pacearchaeota archaeon]|nr:hypothetical protein [Candidatus Pacearchaeota archaeon]